MQVESDRLCRTGGRGVVSGALVGLETVGVGVNNTLVRSAPVVNSSLRRVVAVSTASGIIDSTSWFVSDALKKNRSGSSRTIVTQAFLQGT